MPDSELVSRLKAVVEAGDKLRDEYILEMAQSLIEFGITLIPSDELKDNQFVVSTRVYEAAKKLCQ